MDPHLMAPRISLRGKQQQTNLSKPTENKGRQQRDLQGHHRVCWFPHWVLLLPRPQRQRQRSRLGAGSTPRQESFQAWASTALRLASSSSRHWASKVCLYPDLGALRRRHAPPSSLRGKLRSLWVGEANSPVFCLGFFLSLFPSPWDVTP